MKKIGLLLLLGIGAGLLDAAPMFIMKMNMYATASAFVHWVVLGVIIPSVKWNIKSWLKGIVVALLAVTPVMILVCETEPMSLIPMAASSVILGALLGVVGRRVAE